MNSKKLSRSTILLAITTLLIALLNITGCSESSSDPNTLAVSDIAPNDAPIGTPLYSTVESNTTNRYKFAAVAGTKYMIEIKLGTLTNIKVSLYNNNGKEISSNIINNMRDLNSNNSSNFTAVCKISLTCDESGEYFITVEGVNESDNGTYTLQVVGDTGTNDHDGDGYTYNDGDCNDNDATVYPGATEVCGDKIRQNCRLATANESCVTYYRDQDGDGHGDPNESTVASSAPSGYVTNSTDCDDNDASKNPDITEICADGIDQDCDGVVDNGCEGYVADSAAPETTIVTGPDAIVSTTNSATFTFSATDDISAAAGILYSYKLETTTTTTQLGDFPWLLSNNTYSAWSSDTSATFSNLADGAYTFYVKSKDEADNEDATPATQSFTINYTVISSDTEAPRTVIESGPPANLLVIGSDSVKFTFSGVDDTTDTANLVYSYLLKGLTTKWSDYSSETSVSYSGLDDGDYIFKVKAKDEAGNSDSSSATRSFGIVIAPETTITAGPAAGSTVGSGATVTFSYIGTDNTTPVNQLVYAHKLNDGTWSSWSLETSGAYTVSTPGNYTFYVKVRDKWGNADESPAERSFVVK